MLAESRAEKFDQVITVDHVVTLHPEAAAVEGHGHALTFKDLATEWVECKPLVHRNEEDMTSALRQIFGPMEVIHFVHTDGSDEIRLACKAIGLRQRAAAPGRPQTNGVIERVLSTHAGFDQ